MDSNAQDNTSSAPAVQQGVIRATAITAPSFGALALRPKRKRDTDDSDPRPAAKKRGGPVSPYRHYSSTRTGVFKFEKLPDRAKNRIFELSLLKDGPVTIDSTWCEEWLNEREPLPSAIGTYSRDGESWESQLLWSELSETIDGLIYDLAGSDPRQPPRLHSLLSQLGHHIKHSRAYRPPYEHLTTSLFYVNREISHLAIKFFYTENSFSFPNAANAWMQLEVFLSQIGTQNTKRIRKLSIHVPLTYATIQEDVLAGTILDFVSIARGMRNPRAPLRFQERTLSAVRSSLRTLQQTSCLLESLNLQVQDGEVAELWTGAGDRMLWTADEDLEEHKTRNVQLKRELLRLTAQYRPVVVALVRAPSGESDGNEEFSRRLRDVGKEAEEFGWEVDPYQSSV